MYLSTPSNITRDLILTRITKNEENEQVKIAIPLTVYCSHSSVVLINSPGLGVSKEGESNRFKKIATRIQRANLSSVICYQSSLGDFAFKKVTMEALLLDNLKAVIDYALSEAHSICGFDAPEIFLAGHSAGASTSAAIAFEYPQVSRMLLVAPSADIEPELLRRSLSKFSGELYIVSGDKDYVINPEAVRTFAKWATKAKTKKIVTVKDCDHNFTGQRNRRLLTAAYMWAISDSNSFLELGLKTSSTSAIE
jgi:dienelactone hydrolase